MKTNISLTYQCRQCISIRCQALIGAMTSQVRHDCAKTDSVTTNSCRYPLDMRMSFGTATRSYLKFWNGATV